MKADEKPQPRFMPVNLQHTSKSINQSINQKIFNVA